MEQRGPWIGAEKVCGPLRATENPIFTLLVPRESHGRIQMLYRTYLRPMHMSALLSLI